MGVVALLRHYGVRRDGFTKDGGYTTETGQAASRPFDTSRWLVGSPTRARTWDLRINSPSLYQLSYRGIVRRNKIITYDCVAKIRASVSQTVSRHFRVT